MNLFDGRPSGPWSDEDDKFLELAWGDEVGLGDLVKELGRTPRAIRARAKKLGLDNAAEQCATPAGN